MRFSWLVYGILLLALCRACLHAQVAGAITHRFLAMDESRHAVVFVDENEPAENWRIEFPNPCRDFQLIGNNRLLVNTSTGYAEYDLGSRQRVKELKGTQYAGAETIRRLANGHTIIGCNQKDQGIVFYELDLEDSLLATAAFPKLNTLRLLRLSPRGTLLFGANGNHVVEANMAGVVLRDMALAEGRHIYQVEEGPDGHLFVALGYGQAFVELDSAGNEVRRFGGKPGPEGFGFHFFGGFHRIANGHFVQSNWTGHGPQDSAKGVQIIEFNPSGQIVWQWHHPELAGSIHGVIVMDGANPQSLPDPQQGSKSKKD